MKVLFLCGLTILVTGADLSAQNRPETGPTSKFSLGLYAGPAFAQFRAIEPDDAFDSNFRAGYFAGITARYQLSKYWALRLDNQFSQRGQYYNTPGAFIILNNQFALYRGRVDYRIAYFDWIPEAEFRPARFLSIAAGPYMALRIKEEVRYGTTIDWTDPEEVELFDDADFGLSARVGFQLGPVSVFAAYQHGLSGISNLIATDANGQFAGNLEAKNQAVFAGVQYRFDFKSKNVGAGEKIGRTGTKDN